jgi:hypothetical protein
MIVAPRLGNSLDEVAKVLAASKAIDLTGLIAKPIVLPVMPALEVIYPAPSSNPVSEPRLPNPTLRPLPLGPIDGGINAGNGNVPICGAQPQLMPDGTLKEGAWVEIVIPGQGDPTAEQKLAAEAAKRKRLYLIGGIVFFVLILLIFLVKAMKKNKQN